MTTQKIPSFLWVTLLLAGFAISACSDSDNTTPATTTDTGAMSDTNTMADAGSELDASTNDTQIEEDTFEPPTYPEPAAWPANVGPGGPAVAFPEEMLFENCAYLSGGDQDPTQHHNLVVMYDGYLLMPWAPEFGIGGLTFFDISDPCQPEVAGEGFATTMRETHSIGFSSIGGRWAVVNQISGVFEGGIQFWDVSDPTAPVAVADLPLEGFLYPDAYARVVLSVFWQAPYVYVAQADLGVIVVDATDPTAPFVAGSYQLDPILRAGQIHAIGNMLIVTSAEGPRTVLLDISDPANPQPIPGGDFLITNDEGQPVEAYFSNTGGGYTYYARKEGGGGVMIYDIHDPTNPVKSGALRTEGNGGYVFVKDDLAFVGESNFGALYDISDHDNIEPLGRFNLIGDLDTVTPIGNVAIVSVDDKGEPDRGSSVAPWRSEPDTEPPTVTWVWPPDGSTGLSTASRFGVTFSEMVDVKSAWEGSVRLYATEKGSPEGKVEGYISTQENIVNFWPLAPLELNREYTLEIPAGGVVDYNGNPIAETFTATFTTWELPPVKADAGSNINAYTGDEVVLSGAASSGIETYIWDPNDGSGPTAPSTNPELTVTYDTPGRYRVQLRVENIAGEQGTDEVLVSVVDKPVFTPQSSSTIAVSPDGEKLAVVSPDANRVALTAYTPEGLELPRHIPICDHPQTLAWASPSLLVIPCRDDQIAVVDTDERNINEAATITTVPYGAQPYGVLVHEGVAWVTYQGRGELAAFTVTADGLEESQRFPVITDARGITLLPDGRLAVTRWRSPATHGEIAVVAPDTEAITIWELAFAQINDSDTETGGVPTYLNQIAVSPDGQIAAVPALQANIGVGEFLTGDPLTHETTVRAVLSYLDPATGEPIANRKQFDDRGFASAATYNIWGDFLFVATRGSRAVERLDRFNGAQSGSILEVGFAPEGIAISPDGLWLFVDAYLSRQIRQYSISDTTLPVLIDDVSSVLDEPFDSNVARGARLFNDSFDPRLAMDGYIACAHCHLDGDSDNRNWDFTERGEGLRNTISLLGRAGAGHGPIHWSGNFDEVQDFEHDIRGPFSGLGLMSDDEFHTDGRDTPLGTPKAGVNEDLDALAAFVTSLTRYPRSPHRNDDGQLTEAALRGQTLFESQDTACTTCHAGPHMTDSSFTAPGMPLLHDVGTITTASGQRLGGPLSGIDTPTLRGLWANPPYLHDGSATTVRDVLTTAAPNSVHDVRSMLSEAQISDLETYLLSLDGSDL